LHLKLLFDENLAARLAHALGDLCPGSIHVSTVGLNGAPDPVLWQFAAAHGYVLVTKDGDFQRLSVVYGPPPKVVWLRLGNCTTADVMQVMRGRYHQTVAFVEHADAAFLALGE
jgi:predicted nuclease of predicted toxin-antitoxin system